MTMFLVDDHSVVNRYGHGDPKHSGYREMPSAPPREGMFRARESLTPPIAFADSFFETTESSSPEFTFVFQPEGLTHDAIFLVWTLEGGSWKVKRMFSIVA